MHTASPVAVSVAWPMSPLEYALAAAEAGLCVVPPREDGSKRPLVEWADLQTERPHLERIKTWYSQRRSGMGFVCGATSGNLELFDFDDHAAYEQFRALAVTEGLGDLVERIEDGYLEETPSNGVHWLYRCPEISGNKKLARRLKRPEEQRDPNDKVKVLIETRGEGGYVVAAPSSGRVHATGKPYRLLRGSVDLITSITPDERDKLWSLARTLDQMPVEKFREPIPATARIPSGTKRPGDDFNERASWAEILQPFGWVMVAQHGDETFWRRPGSENKWSASTNYRGSDLLYVFTTSSMFDSEKAYSKFAAYTLLVHGGDFSAAAHALSDKGYGEQAITLDVPLGGLSAPSGSPDGAAAVTAQVDPYPIQTLAQLLDRPAVEIAELVEGLLWAARTHWWFSDPNVGKTLILLALGLHISAGRAFCGLQVKQGAVLLIEEDSSLAVLSEYVEMLCEIYDFDLEALPFYVNQVQGLRIANADGRTVALQAIKSCPEPLVLIIWDTAERLVPSESFTSKELDQFGQLLQYTVNQGISNAVVDHTKKPPTPPKGEKPKTPTDPSELLNLLYGARAKGAISDVMTHFGGGLKAGNVKATFCKMRGELPSAIDIQFQPDTGFTIRAQLRTTRTPTEQKIVKWLNSRPVDWYQAADILSGAEVPERSGKRALTALKDRRLIERDDARADKNGALYRLKAAPEVVFS